MKIRLWIEPINGNCLGDISFELHANGHIQLFKTSVIAINKGNAKQSNLKLECLRGLFTQRLPYLLRELEKVVNIKTGVDQDREVFKFADWEWEIK